VLKAGQLKIKLCLYQKKERIGVAVPRCYLFLFLSHRRAVLSRGTQQNCQKMLECSNLPNPSVSLSSLSGQIYPIRSNISIGFQNRGTASRSDISDPISDISDVSDMSSPRRVLELWQAVQVRHIHPQVGYI
jgi:hypothetical protein